MDTVNKIKNQLGNIQSIIKQNIDEEVDLFKRVTFLILILIVFLLVVWIINIINKKK